MFDSHFLLGIVITILIAILAYVFSEKGLPIVDYPSEDEGAGLTEEKKKKIEQFSKLRNKFWARVISGVALLIGLAINLIVYAIDQVDKIDNHVEALDQEIDIINGNFNKLEGQTTRIAFQSLYNEYLDKYQKPNVDPISKKWSHELAEWTRKDLENLSEEIALGKVELLSHNIASAILPLYEQCDIGIVASNIGGTKSFFNTAYIRANSKLSQRGKPVVRFYLYSSEVSMELRNSLEPEKFTFENYLKEVEELHIENRNVLSVVINFDMITDEFDREAISRDMLIVDRRVKAEAELTKQSWELLNETLTNNDKFVSEGLRAFSKMCEITHIDDKNVCRVYKMENDEIKTIYRDFILSNGIDLNEKNLAFEILNHLVLFPNNN